MYPNEPPVPIDKECKGCSLTCDASIAGRGPTDPADVKLIVISDYPGAYESEFGWPQVPNDWVQSQRQKKAKLQQPPNSGAFLRALLHRKYGLDTFTDTWITNALRCNPNFNGRTGKATDRNLGNCTSMWGHQEFVWLDHAVPTVPILAAGAWALKLVKLLYRDLAPTGTVDSLLRYPGLMAGRHPLVVTYNPASYARSYSQIETSVYVNRRSGLVEVTKVAPLDNFIYGSTLIYEGDLAELDRHLTLPILP